MARYVADIETDGLLHELTRIHVLVLRDIDTGAIKVYRKNCGEDTIEHGVREMESADLLVLHNGCKFDCAAIKQVYPWFTVDESKVVDTLVLARLIYADLQVWDTKLVKQGRLPNKLFRKHSLEAWGHRLGARKGDYTGGWENWSQEMEDYCIQDTLTTAKLYEHLAHVIERDQWPQRCIELEHQVAWIIARQERRGIAFDLAGAAELLAKLTERKLEIEAELRKVFPPFYKKGKEVTPARDNKKQGYVGGAPFTRVDLTEFNPGSRDHIALMLKRRYGWEPVEFTGDGKPKIDETVLGGLSYPEAALLRDYLTVDKRIGQLATGDQAWMKCERNGRIHGSVVTNGAVTGRMTHAHPNLAQIPASRSPWGYECRSLFGPTKGFVQVGADASALELRDFAGYLAAYDQGAYIETVTRGSSADGTDVHSVNARALGLDPKRVYFAPKTTGRDIAKTWFSMGTPAGQLAGKQLCELREHPTRATLNQALCVAAERRQHMKYPNGYFRKKPCRCCGTEFQPEAPSNLYCSVPCQKRGTRNAYLIRSYGIPLKEYERKLEDQGHRCAICGGDGFLMRDTHQVKLLVDHDHDTGAVRGLLCHNCNRALGLLQDSPEVVLAAFNYLAAYKEGATTIPKGSTPQAIGGGSAEPPTHRGEEIVWTRRQRRAVS